MLEMAGKFADGTQMSDVTPEKIGHHMEHLRKGLAERKTPVEDFRIGNFWAWHVKEDVTKSLYEARRELVFRGELLPPQYDMLPYVTAGGAPACHRQVAELRQGLLDAVGRDRGRARSPSSTG